MNKLAELLRTVVMVLVAVAVGQELAKRPEERTWHGMVGGFVPYDFRTPTIERLRKAYWNPNNPRLLTSRVFGLGWGINFYRVWQWLKATCGEAQEQSAA